MAIDVRSKQVGSTGIVKHGAPELTPQALGTKLWNAFRSAVSAFVAPVPSQAKGGVLADVLRLLIGGESAPRTMGRAQALQMHVTPRAGDHFEKVAAHAAKEPPSKWTDHALVRARDTLREVAFGLPKERLEKDLFALPHGAVLHEDGALQPWIDRAPAHVEVRATAYLNTIDDVARFLQDEVRRDGKTHAQEVNGAIIELRPGGNAKDAIAQWEARRVRPADEGQASSMLSAVEREIDVRSQRTEQHTLEQRRAGMAAQLKALPPGADVFAHDPAKLRDEQPGVGVKSAPFLLSLEEAAQWLAKQAATSGNVSAYRFNDDLLVGDPRAGRGEALVRSVLEGWEKLH